MACGRKVPGYMRPTESWKRRGGSGSVESASSKPAQAGQGRKQSGKGRDAMERMAEKVRAKAVETPFEKVEESCGGKGVLEKVVEERPARLVSKLPRLSSSPCAGKVLPVLGGRIRASKIPKAPEGGLCETRSAPVSCRVASKAERMHEELWGRCGLLDLVPGKQSMLPRRNFGYGIHNVKV